MGDNRSSGTRKRHLTPAQMLGFDLARKKIHRCHVFGGLIMIRAVLPALIFIFTCSALNAYADCDTNLKPTDSNREISEKLRCLADEITALKRNSVSSTGTIRTSQTEPAEMQKCIMTSSLPNVAHFILRANGKFCRDDGIVWLRVTSNLQQPSNSGPAVGFNLIENGTSSNCFPTDASCPLEDSKSGRSSTYSLKWKRGQWRRRLGRNISACLQRVRECPFPNTFREAASYNENGAQK